MKTDITGKHEEAFTKLVQVVLQNWAAGLSAAATLSGMFPCGRQTQMV